MTQAQDKATPRPWRVDPSDDGRPYIVAANDLCVAKTYRAAVGGATQGISSIDGEANAALIVSAVNERDAHERCVKFLREMVEAAEKGHIDSEQLPGEPEVGLRPYKWHEEWTHYAKEALAALEKANG